MSTPISREIVFFFLFDKIDTLSDMLKKEIFGPKAQQTAYLFFNNDGVVLRFMNHYYQAVGFEGKDLDQVISLISDLHSNNSGSDDVSQIMVDIKDYFNNMLRYYFSENPIYGYSRIVIICDHMNNHNGSHKALAEAFNAIFPSSTQISGFMLKDNFQEWTYHPHTCNTMSADFSVMGKTKATRTITVL